MEREQKIEVNLIIGRRRKRGRVSVLERRANNHVIGTTGE